jgi:mono/diheme cytochrome c family protein
MQRRILETVIVSLVAGGASNPLAAADEPVMTLEQTRPASSSESGLGKEVDEGSYLADLLSCGSCHTDGALIGVPRPDGNLTGSEIGIAYYSAADKDRPGIAYPRNLTPDSETGLGAWTDDQIARAIRGETRHRSGESIVMPWPTFSKLSDEDVRAIVAYLRSLPPVRHRVPESVEPGAEASGRYVEFGMRQSGGPAPPDSP